MSALTQTLETTPALLIHKGTDDTVRIPGQPLLLLGHTLQKGMGWSFTNLVGRLHKLNNLVTSAVLLVGVRIPLANILEGESGGSCGL